MSMKQIRETIRRAYGAERIAIRQAANPDETGAQVYKLKGKGEWRWVGSFSEVCKQLGILTVRDDVESITYHRPPTTGELRFGEGATHYRDFDIEDCCYKGTRIAKRWLVASDGLRYYR